MKICILSDGIPPEGKGGAERIAWDSAKMLASAGHEVTVITTTRTVGEKTVRTTVEDIPVYSISSTYHVRWRAWVALRNPKVVREVKKIFSELKPDIVHAHNVHQYLSYASLSVAHSFNVPVFHTIHDAMPFNYDKLTAHPGMYKVFAWQQFTEYRFRYNPFRNLIIRTILKKVRVLAVSKELAAALKENGIKNVRVLHNGIDASQWKVSSEIVEEFKKEKDLQNKKVLLFGGRITGTKGGDVLLAALPGIVRAIPETTLLIIGMENDYVRSLLKRAESEGLKENIRVTGWIAGDELRAAYHAADVVTVPSVYLDPLPTVVLEAMACAKPVVGSSFGGIPEMVLDGRTGYVVNPLDTADLVEKCVVLLSNTDLAKRLGATGAEVQAAAFSQKVHLNNLLHEYRNAFPMLP